MDAEKTSEIKRTEIIKISKSLHKVVKVAAANAGVPIYMLAERALEAWLSGGTSVPPRHDDISKQTSSELTIPDVELIGTELATERQEFDQAVKQRMERLDALEKESRRILRNLERIGASLEAKTGKRTRKATQGR